MRTSVFYYIVAGGGIVLALPQTLEIPAAGGLLNVGGLLVFEEEKSVCNVQNMDTYTPHFDCPKRDNHRLDENGFCSSTIKETPDKERGCKAYCELSINLKFDTERPFKMGSCIGPQKCTITMGESISYTTTWEVNMGLSVGKRETNETLAIIKREDDAAKAMKATFNAGASYSFSETLTYSVSSGFSWDLKDGQCGYFTFVPWAIESCGTLTAAEVDDVPLTNGARSLCDTKQLKNQEDYCNTAPYTNSDGRPDGKVIMVYTDCAKGGLLPMDQQNEDYRHPGVSTGTFPEDSV